MGRRRTRCSPPRRSTRATSGTVRCGIAEAHRAVIAEHHVERARGERQRLRAREHERHRASRRAARCAAARGGAVRARGRVRRRSRAVPHGARPTTARRRSPARARPSGDVAEDVELATRAAATHPTRAARAASSSPCTSWYASASASQNRAIPVDVIARRRGALASNRTSGACPAAWLRSRPMSGTCVSSASGSPTARSRPDLSGTMLEAQAFRRALDDAGLAEVRHRRARERGLRRDARGAARRVPRAHAALARVDVVRRFELRVPGDARVPRDPSRRRRHGRDRLRQQPAVARSGARSAPAAGAGRGGGMAMPLPMAYEFPTGITLVGFVRDGRAAAHAPVRHDARTARVDRGADARARGPQSRMRCTAIRSRSTTCSVPSSSPTRCTSSTAA